jgi:hypothetical protein
MYARRLAVRLSVLVFLSSCAGPVFAQSSQPPDPHAQHTQQPSTPDPHARHAMPGTMLFDVREASGTAWLPEATPMYGVFHTAGPWQVMWHGNAFLQYLRDAGHRGSDQAGSINWIMGMARRTVGRGRLGFRGMASVEPWTIRGCGYPDLLATGEVCDGEAIHDRQHPHDLFMELAAEYDHALRGAVRWQLYGGFAGEPALGPVAYPHRPSAMPNPLAPIGHHWLDATHITFGVVTAGVYGSRWKLEASSFNGREPDQHRRGFDFAALDSVSARVWWLPNPSLAVQMSAGYLSEAEPGHSDAGPRVDVNRVTASATYHRALGSSGLWATTIAWGRNEEEGAASHALLAETNVSWRDRDNWFARLEAGGKPAHDLDLHGREGNISVGKVQGGYTRYLLAGRPLQPGVGASVSAGIVPRSLEAVYGRRVNVGFGMFVTVRPSRHVM